MILLTIGINVIVLLHVYLMYLNLKTATICKLNLDYTTTWS